MLTASELRLKSKSPRSVSFFHINVRSVRNKEAELHALFRNIGFKWSVIKLTETWYSDEEEILGMPNYLSLFINRKEGHGGGLLL